MRFRYLLAIVLFCGLGNAYGQVPDLINYQAVVRDASGASVTNQLIGVRIGILQGSPTGTEVYAETHTPTTNGYGLVNLQIGAGSPLGPAMSTIDWSADTYFIEVRIDPAGGTSYSIISTTQLVSVPYALHARTAEQVDDADADPTNEINTSATLTGTTLDITDGGGTVSVDLVSLGDDADADPNNEIQTISKAGSIITLSNGGGAVTDDVNDADSNPANEFNTSANLSGTNLNITDGGGTLSVNLASLGDDADADPTNEYNTGGNLTGTTLNITDGGGTVSVNLSSLQDGVNDADADPTNEYNTGGNLTGTTLNIIDGGGTVSVNLSSLQDGVDDADNDPSNEYNTSAVLSGTDLEITDGGGTLTVDLSSLGGGVDPSATNELNTSANLTGTDLNITDAGGTLTVDLSSLGDDADADPTNEYNTSANLTGTDLNITDAGGTLTVDLSPLTGGSQIRVGQHYQGGIVVFVDSTGIHGLICAYADVSTGIEFDPPGDGNATTGYAASLFDGQANTTALVTQWGPGSTYAAGVCDAYTGGGYTDWYLPSVWELDLILHSGYVLRQYALTYTSYYWSSTEDGVGAFLGINALQLRSLTYAIQSTSELNLGRVRPVRQF